MSEIRYGRMLIDVAMINPREISDQVEIVRVVGHQPQHIEVLIKSTVDRMPDGAMGPDGDVPLLVCEVAERQLDIRFRK